MPTKRNAPSALRSILITGGSSGIGAALALELAARNCDVIISGRRQNRLDEVAARSGRISTCVGDVTDPAHRARSTDALVALSEPRGVVHGAGYFQAGRLDALDLAAWRRSFDTNVSARLELSQACLPLLDHGRVLFIGSDAGADPRDGAAAYSIAQAASETLRRALQVEWADRSVAVGAFKPGLVDTDMVRAFMALPATEFPARAVYEEYVQSGRIATPRSIARFAAWLLLDVPPRRFSETEWDVRDDTHHTEWSDGPLYPNSTP